MDTWGFIIASIPTTSSIDITDERYLEKSGEKVGCFHQLSLSGAIKRWRGRSAPAKSHISDKLNCSELPRARDSNQLVTHFSPKIFAIDARSSDILRYVEQMHRSDPKNITSIISLDNQHSNPNNQLAWLDGQYC